MGYTIKCDCCGYYGYYNDEIFYEKGIDLIDILKKKMEVPEYIEDVCRICYEKLLSGEFNPYTYSI